MAKKRTLEAINRVPPASVTEPIKKFKETQKRLTDRQQELLNLYYLEEVGTLKDVANKMGISHSLARTENARIKEKFKEICIKNN